MRQKNKKTVFVALSGGVDSSVAAALLQKGGCAIVGVHLKCGNVDGCGQREAEDARRAAEQLRIPFYVFDFESEYRRWVVDYMVDGYRRGLTPNPDVMCNREIKFGLFLERALRLGADYVATGHYVRLQRRTGRCFYGHQNNFSPAAKFSFPSADLRSLSRATKPNRPAGYAPRNSGQSISRQYSLLAAKDKNKDQSYFLWTLTQEQLKHCLFPIGEYTKPQVRILARRFGLLTAEKKDSQGICFLGKVTLTDFLGRYLPAQTGAVLNLGGEAIGEHRGAHYYTIGQRHGFSYRIRNRESGIKGDTKPHYVVQKNVVTNVLVVAEGENDPALLKREILLKNLNLINPPIHDSQFMIPVLARVRYRQTLAPARLETFPHSQECGNVVSGGRREEGGGKGKLMFDRPQKFVAPGQSAVFYTARGELLGGGIIV